MRSAKTLSKMNEKEKAKEMLPNWFQGEIYELGDEVRNPFSGETCLLDAAELSMYDLIKGMEFLAFSGLAPDLDECIDMSAIEIHACDIESVLEEVFNIVSDNS